MNIVLCNINKELLQPMETVSHLITLQIYTNILEYTTNSQIFLGIQTIYKQYKLHYVVIKNMSIYVVYLYTM